MVLAFLGLIPISQYFSGEKIINVVEVNKWRWFEESVGKV